MNQSTIDILKSILNGVSIFFMIYIIGYSTFLFLSVVVGSSVLYHRKRQELLKNTLLKDYYVPVSIIVPAHNEEVTVVETIRSLLALDYTLFEIIIVDDGSNDSTAKKIIDTFHLHLIHRPIRKQIECKPEICIFEGKIKGVSLMLICKGNGGKADSLNMGINASRFPYFICMDADSALQNDSLKKIVRHMLESNNIVAIGGTVRPANDVEIERGEVKRYRLPSNILACMQVLEYDRSFLATRIFFDTFNGALIISGAFGLFRKDIVIYAGGYDQATIGEDMELVVKLHAYCVSNGIPYRIGYATDAICWSQVPENMKDLSRQRRRWQIGLFQSMFKHRRLLFNPKYGAVSFISYLYFLFYELFSPLIEILGIFSMLIAFAIDLINIQFMIIFFIIYVLYGLILSLTAFFARTQTTDLTLSIHDIFKAVLLCILEVSCLRFVLTFVRLTAFVDYKKQRFHWGKINRRKINIK